MRCWEGGSGWITSVCDCHCCHSRQWLCNILRSILKLTAGNETRCNDGTHESVLESFHSSKNESSYYHCDFDVCKYVSFWTLSPIENELYCSLRSKNIQVGILYWLSRKYLWGQLSQPPLPTLDPVFRWAFITYQDKARRNCGSGGGYNLQG